MNKKLAVSILMLTGILFLVITLVSVSRSVSIKKHGLQAQGTVISKSGKKGLSTVTVHFDTPDGNTVTAKAAKRGSVSAGDKVMIWYERADPQKIDFGDTIGYNMRGVFIGGLFFIIGFYYFIRYSIADKKNKKLISSGQKIAAEFVSVDRNEKYNMGDNNPWLIKCKWTDNRNGQEYYFVSKDYTIDPVPYLNGRSSIDVFIDLADPSRYFMETTFMPKGNNTIG
jgi:hypothetical protein